MPKPTTKQKSKSGGYTGALAEPIYLNGSLARRIDPTGNLESTEKDRGIAQLIAKLPALFRCYEIEMGSENDWMFLALALAKTHVPGMRISLDPKPRRGPRAKWGPDLEDDGELLREVESLQSANGYSIKDACEELRKDKSKKFGQSSLVNLIARHREARRADAQRKHLEKLSNSDSLYRALGSPLGNKKRL